MLTSTDIGVSLQIEASLKCVELRHTLNRLSGGKVDFLEFDRIDGVTKEGGGCPWLPVVHLLLYTPACRRACEPGDPLSTVPSSCADRW